MKLNTSIDIRVSQTEARFEDEQGRAVRVESRNGETTSFDAFVEVIEGGAQQLGTTPEELVKRLDVVKVSMPDLVDTIVANRLGTVIGLMVTEKEEATIYQTDVGANPLFDFLVAPEMVVSVREEVNQQGQMVLAPDSEEIRDKVRYLLERGAGALVVSLKNSAINPINEKTVKKMIESDYPRHYLGAVPVLISSDFGSEQDDFTRTSGCLLNVYCWAGVDDAISRMETYLRERRFVGTFLIAEADGTTVSRPRLIPLNTSGSKASRR